MFTLNRLGVTASGSSMLATFGSTGREGDWGCPTLRPTGISPMNGKPSEMNKRGQKLPVQIADKIFLRLNP